MRTAWDAIELRRIVLVGLSFLAGALLIVVLVGGLLPSDPSLEETALIEESEVATSQFINVVVLGVNQLLQRPPALEAVWVGTFDLALNNGVFLGLPRTFILNNGLSMAQAFSWSEDNLLDPDFVLAVQETLTLDFDAVVVMDRVCFQAGIDFIGGLPTDTGQEMNGSAALALHALSAYDPWMALEVQAEILSRVSLRLDDLGQRPDLTPLLNQTPEHCWLSISDEAALGMMLEMFPLDQDAIRVETIADVN